MGSRAGADSVALVTGASSGFGLLTCLEPAHRGLREARIVFTLSRVLPSRLWERFVQRMFDLS